MIIMEGCRTKVRDAWAVWWGELAWAMESDRKEGQGNIKKNN